MIKLIISVSRRTDIPAFYSTWFYNCLEKGEVLVPNPFNRKQLSKIYLNKESVDCFVFWTKNPRPFISRLNLLKGYNYYFQFTVTSYQADVEPNVPKKTDIIKTFAYLSEKIGKERVIWRYDPILLSDKYTKEYHYEWFEKLANYLAPYTTKCVISFIDLYKKTTRNTKLLELKELSREDKDEIVYRLSKICNSLNLKLETCSEEGDYSQFGVERGHCIDVNLINKIAGKALEIGKDKNQREVCGCAQSRDIGMYNTCMHKCRYCYANYSDKKVEENRDLHCVNSSILIGIPKGDEKIYIREK